MKVRYSYLPEQFAEIDDLIAEIRRFVPTGDFTLGKPLAEFERRFAAMIGARHAIGVGSGTDALKLALRAAGVGHGDEVITAANTFIATVGAIIEIGARPVFVECDDSFCLDVCQVESRIGAKTRAIVPVHLTGNMVDMPALMAVASARGIPVVEDAAQAILARVAGRNAGLWGRAAAFSLHPLKNLNVWGDGGVIATDDDAMDRTLRLLRNHGLKSRDEVAMPGYNSRLDSLQAIVGNWLIGRVEAITAKRIENAHYLDRGLAQIPGVRVPPRPAGMRSVFHIYMIFAERRDELLRHCLAAGIESKIHYPIPLYRQEGLRFLGYPAGAFPVTDRHAGSIISFPADQHLGPAELDQVIAAVRDFYGRSR